MIVTVTRSVDRLRTRDDDVASAPAAGKETPVPTGDEARPASVRLRPKKLMNTADSLVRESLAAFGSAHRDLVCTDVDRRLVLRADAPIPGKVGIVSGGGSGHEPLDIGFVGAGMLDAACVGEIFSSPSSDQVRAATEVVDGGAGVLYVVKNYTGDTMNFTIAAEHARAAGIDVSLVFTDDDVALEGAGRTPGRRGTGVTPLVHKIAGAGASAGYDLERVTGVAGRANTRGRTLGIALESCVSPNLGKPTFELGPDEIEFGVGIHGEPGRRRGKLAPASELVEEMVADILADLQPAPDAELLVFVNGFGATPLMELYVVFGELVRRLGERGFRIARNLVGNYVTSLNMAGMSITLLELDDELLRLWDAPVHTASLRWG